jgi:hypothetical protein
MALYLARSQIERMSNDNNKKESDKIVRFGAVVEHVLVVVVVKERVYTKVRCD